MVGPHGSESSPLAGSLCVQGRSRSCIAPSCSLHRSRCCRARAHMISRPLTAIRRTTTSGPRLEQGKTASRPPTGLGPRPTPSAFRTASRTATRSRSCPRTQTVNAPSRHSAIPLPACLVSRSSIRRTQPPAFGPMLIHRGAPAPTIKVRDTRAAAVPYGSIPPATPVSSSISSAVMGHGEITATRSTWAGALTRDWPVVRRATTNAAHCGTAYLKMIVTVWAHT